jgi:hypothetical protein
MTGHFSYRISGRVVRNLRGAPARALDNRRLHS